MVTKTGTLDELTFTLKTELKDNARLGFKYSYLDELTSALKTEFGDTPDVAVLTFKHWLKTNYDLTGATPELLERLERAFVKKYNDSSTMQRDEALAVLAAYQDHFYGTSTVEERQKIAMAMGITPVEFKVLEEGFSLRELAQALKRFAGVWPSIPKEVLPRCFDRYCEKIGRLDLIGRMSEAMAPYRKERAMESLDKAKAILGVIGIEMLDAGKPKDMQVRKKVSGAREH